MLPAVLAMRPRYVEKLWAGSRLKTLPAKRRTPPPPGTGEAWEVADLPEGASTVDGGPLDGLTLRTVVERFGRAVCGARTRAVDGALRFPLLVKLIDAGDDLSVQVHPGEAFARAHPGSFAKDEAWLVVAVEPGARVLHGVRDGVDAAAFAEAVVGGRADALLREVRVSVGDVLRIAPGTLHGVGKGCLLLEVQQPSDTTFRVWDYDRVDKDGHKRPLHIEQALAVARFGKQDPPLVSDARPGRRAIATAHYAMGLEAVTPGAPRVVDKPRGEPAVVFVLDGSVTVGGVELPAGAAAVVVADADGVVAEGDGTLVVMTPGDEAAA